MKLDQACPGSVDEKPHNLIIIDPNTGNKICDNDRCYFQYINSKGEGVWQSNFDYINAKSFVKPKREVMED